MMAWATEWRCSTTGKTRISISTKKTRQPDEGCQELGVDLFLLDDGWFGNKYPRKDDHAGLATGRRLAPNSRGIPALVSAAKDAGVKFGIWIEPEMVNPKRTLRENIPDWAIHLPKSCETYYYRNQLVLDLSNPQVQDYVYGIIGRIMKDNPHVVYFKWDCNSPINPTSTRRICERQPVEPVYQLCARTGQRDAPCEEELSQSAADALFGRRRTLRL